MKASVAQRPVNFIVGIGMPAKYTAIAAPLRREWRPILNGSNPKISFPIIEAASLSLVNRK